jgi:hypothetical protein
MLAIENVHGAIELAASPAAVFGGRLLDVKHSDLRVVVDFPPSFPDPIGPVLDLAIQEEALIQ